MVWGLMVLLLVLLVLVHEYSRAGCVPCAGLCWISMDIHGYRMCGYPWISSVNNSEQQQQQQQK
jgi:hypothetical protein